MNTLRTLSMLSAVGLLTATSAQALAAQDTAPQAPPATQTQPNTSPDPTAASSPHQREATGQQETDKTGKGVDEAPPAANPDPSGATSPHQQDTVKGAEGANERAAGKDKQMAGDTKPKDKLVGLIVETPAGEPVGSVVDIVRDDAGMPTHVIVAIDNETTAVPYQTASSMVRDGKVVMNQQRLAGAPKVKQTEWLDQSSSKWRTASDRYWGNTRTASPGPGDEEKPTPR
jgi:hypothetical protein